MVRKKTMFVKPKNKHLAEMISLRNPHAAMGSVKELKREFNSAKTLKKKLRIRRAVQLAINRSKACLDRKDLSQLERGEFFEISRIYTLLKEELAKAYPAKRKPRVRKLSIRRMS